MPEWTKQQHNAIKARNRNVLVSAAAGSGKTAVLVERVIKLITDENNPVDIDKLLIVTFTNAAAAEMRTRISGALNKILLENPADMNAARQLSLVPAAKICTIDSFCINLVRENFFELGINQDFGLLDGAKADILSETAINTVIDDYFENDDEVFKTLLEMFSSSKDNSAFADVIKRIHTYIYAQPFPFEWLKEMVEKYNPKYSMQDSDWINFLKSELRSNINFAIGIINSSYDILLKDDLLFDKYTDMLNINRQILENLIDALDSSWDDMKNAYSNIRFKSMPYKKGYVSPVKEELAERHNAYKDIVNKKNFERLMSLSEADYYDDMEYLYPIMLKLYEVVLKVDEELSHLKDESNEYTFADVEQFAIKLLFKNENGEVVPTQLSKDLSDDFYEILIDEYQDTNRAQDMLFQVLSNGSNRFMVGDIKQSIYRFRLAMPEIFNEKKEKYLYYNPDKQTDSKIILDKNFRSRDEICKYVNYVFSILMQKEVGDIEYNEDEYLNYGAKFGDTEIPSAQIKILNNTKTADLDEKEAVYIAETINKKINSKEQIWDKDHFRDIEYGDIVILLRSQKGHTGIYTDVLTSYGIPVVCDNSSNLFESNEIRILTSFLKIIDNPMQDIPLLAVMMSAIYGFTADEMAQIRVDSAKGSLYSAVLRSDMPKVKEFLKDIEILRKNSVTMSVAYFIRFLCEFKNIFALANALGNGEQRVSNINKLIEFAKNFDASDSVGLTSFMRLLAKVEESDRGIEGPSISAGAQNAVSIMSVHKSKGLEFPVVILAGAERKYNNSDLSEKILLSSDGIGVKRFNSELLCQTYTFPYLAMQNISKCMSMGENLRVLYVAMTRAKEQFISFVTVDNLEKKVIKLAPKIINGKIAPYYIKNIERDSDIFLLCALMHKNGQVLRDLTGQDVTIKYSDFDLNIEVTENVSEIAKPENNVQCRCDNDIVEKINEKLQYKYDYINLSKSPAKRNASCLDDSIKSMKYFASSKPAFLNKSGLTPGQRGTAMHTFMQFCDYEIAKADLESEIARITDKGFLSAEQAESLNRNALMKFFNSDFAERMFNSDNIYREIKVSSFVSLSEFEDTDSHEEVLIQGISDCVFEENGELILVDYKTDRVSDEKELLDMYKNQIAFYKSAVSKTLNMNVKQAVLYSFHLGKVCYYN